MINALKKLNRARLEFQNAQIKMSGENKYVGYKYYELADVLPVINRFAEEQNFSCVVKFGDRATLDFVDLDNNETIQFTSPMATAALKGAHDVQNLGAAETYIKRYLYQHAFEIVEADALNGSQGKADKKEFKPPKISRERAALEAEVKTLLNQKQVDRAKFWEKYESIELMNYAQLIEAINLLKKKTDRE